jgi:glycosyltransferase 2 family protein
MRLDWRGALGIVLSGFLLWWALRGEDLGEVWNALATSNVALFAAATVAATLIFPLRARRWRTILDPIAPRLPFAPLWRATAVGMMVNNVVPARAGELARAYALTRETDRVSFPAALASLAVDRLFDAVVLLLLMFVAVLDPGFPDDVRIAGQPVAVLARGGIVLVAALLVLLYSIVFFPARLIRAFELLTRRVAPRLEQRGVEALRAFAAGLGVLRHPGRFASVFGWTLAHWLLNALALWLGFRAVRIGVPFSAALFIQGLLSVAAAIPSSPGFFGLFESAAKLGLAVYAVDQTLAVSWALGYHILTFIPITVIGAVYFVRLGLRMRDVSRAGAA